MINIRISTIVILISILFANTSFAAANNACSLAKLKEGKACNTEKEQHKSSKHKDEFINNLENYMKTLEKDKK